MIEKQRCNFLNWLCSFKVTRILFLLIILMISVTIVLNHKSDNKKLSVNRSNKDSQLKRNQLFYKQYNLNDFKEILKNDNLEQRVSELFKIRESILNELVYLENRRQKQQEEITSFTLKLDEIKSQIVHKQNELTRLHLSLEQAEYSQKEVVLKNRPFISNPLKIIDDNNLFHLNLTTSSIQATNSIRLDQKLVAIKKCSMHRCFDYSRCPLTKKLNAYLYRSFIDAKLNRKEEENEFPKLLKNNLIEYCELNFNLISELDRACLIILPVFERNQINLISTEFKNQTNILLINFGNESISDDKLPSPIMIAQNNFNELTYRTKFDLILPSIDYLELNYKQNQLITSTVKRYLHCPAKRKYFVSCLNAIEKDDKTNLQLATILNGIFNNNLNKFDQFHLDFNYSTNNFLNEHLKEIYSQSTFTLILPNSDLSSISSERIHQQLASILSTNSIPILLGDYQIELPFSEVLDWSLVLIKLPLARVSELHLILKSISDNDLLKMRANGKLFYERYLSRIDYVISNLFAILKSKRLQMPLRSIEDAKSNLIYNKQDRPMHFYEINTELLENTNDIDENLGPIEPAFASITYQRNYSTVLIDSYRIWNSDNLNPFFMFPHSPFDSILPSDAKFKGSNYGFRPIKNGLGGSGKEFSESIGGNYQREQFTIVILTFERQSVLIDSLQRLKSLPYLNKIVIIWNSKSLPESDLKWPELGVEIVVIKAEKNSLNNRFKPYDVIETEAILSMDDDVHLRNDEIIFGFRVWREARERIVGFPGRYHAWHNEWLYNSNYSCELSMVLTGAAFFHKVSFVI